MALLNQLVDGVVVHKFELSSDVVKIGRKASNDIVIDDVSVSTSHAKIWRRPNPHFPEYNEFFIQDLNSTNGTEINGVAILGEKKLNNNDRVKIAFNEFKFIDESQEDLEKTVHMLKS